MAQCQKRITTRAKVKQLKDQLKNIKKTGKINEYLLSIKEIIDMLVAIDSPPCY
ncbi:hypothetical protein SESBI_31986 [Sesbania bispinosa]|nr:hypothetical protein SESBI_31986 [Sesbania bispinosa]